MLCRPLATCQARCWPLASGRPARRPCSCTGSAPVRQTLTLTDRVRRSRVLAAIPLLI